MKTRHYLFISTLLVFTSACLPKNASNAKAGDDELFSSDSLIPPDSDSEKALKLQLVARIRELAQVGKVCAFFGNYVFKQSKLGKYPADDALSICGKELVEANCRLVENTSADVAGNAANEWLDPGEKLYTPIQMGNDAVRPIVDGFTRCFLAKSSKAALNNMLEAVGAGTERIRAKSEVALQGLRNNVFLRACRSTAGTIGSVIAKNPDSPDFDKACSFKMDRNRFASCLKTAGDVCSILTGSDVSFDALLPSDAGELTKLSSTIASSAATELCKAGGQASSVACAALNAAGKQIRDAIMSGNNDWGHCLGTDQAGVCMYDVAYRWTNGLTQEEVAGSTFDTPSPSKTGDSEITCCVCDRVCYANDGYVSNTQLGREKIIHSVGTVTSTGKPDQVTCRNAENNKTPFVYKKYKGYDTYSQLEGCQLMKIRADRGTASCNMPVATSVDATPIGDASAASQKLSIEASGSSPCGFKDQ